MRNDAVSNAGVLRVAVNRLTMTHADNAVDVIRQLAQAVAEIDFDVLSDNRTGLSEPGAVLLELNLELVVVLVLKRIWNSVCHTNKCFPPIRA